MKYLFLLLLTCGLCADWNEEFDAETEQLIAQMPLFQDPLYLQERDYFLEARDKVLHSSALLKRLNDLEENEKKIFYKEDFVVKKRHVDRIQELFVWELSFLINAQEFVLSAFPVALQNCKTIVQRKESFQYELDAECPRDCGSMGNVTLENYWKAHIAAYLLGMSDLINRNIGISREGAIRFFDNEHGLYYVNSIKHDDLQSFQRSFRSASFDWPQYRMPLDKQTAHRLRKYVASLEHFEEQFALYHQLRAIPFKPQRRSGKNGLFERLNIIRAFAYEEGSTFRDLYGTFYPRMDPGLEELNRLVERVFYYPVDHGTSLYFVSHKMYKSSLLTKKDREALKKWKRKYLD